MKNTFTLLLACLLLCCCHEAKKETITTNNFVRIDGHDLIKSNGEKLFLQGINLGNWLNPEGYMFFFKEANSYRLINTVFCELVGEDYTNDFWKKFKDNYITKDDIAYIKKTGMNSIRIPFHYKLFTNEDYMGANDSSEGFRILDELLEWCRDENLYVILDMHDAPGGQTGDNIDDSYGYPWLMTSEKSQEKFCNIWKEIAQHYANDTLIVGYDLLNEPISNNFIADNDSLNSRLEPLYKRCIDSIRTVDNNHIILLGGAQWNRNFEVFNDPTYDEKVMYTCHAYWCDTTANSVKEILEFREKVNRPMYMGETGENTDEWVAGYTRMMNNENIGWHYWPYKKMPIGRCMTSIPTPDNWDLITEYALKDRSTFSKIREHRPDQELVKKAMSDLIENMKLENCNINNGYIEALGMVP